MSAIQDFIFKLNMMETRAKFLKNHKVLVGWANDAYEKPRTKNKRVNNLGHKKNERITIDVDGKEFIGPMVFSGFKKNPYKMKKIGDQQCCVRLGNVIK